jgi:hypothetical protein
MRLQRKEVKISQYIVKKRILVNNYCIDAKGKRGYGELLDEKNLTQ